jgi:hypothetical protein
LQQNWAQIGPVTSIQSNRAFEVITSLIAGQHS